MKHDQAFVIQLANQLMFTLSENEAREINEDFDVLLAQLDLLDDVNTENVEPMAYPFEDETDFLREDVVSHVITQDEALANVKVEDAGLIVVPKVVK
ncbi:MAG: Asp-tRNA(Asn)/Glu-tRNA(Gln) amidotransferase subunit GatC [Erysipelotrichaceae bacterium]|jgi:aspartyl-tRNA(Asn)/glutamyl-tRNA(Gln) amidotransferase subunit C|nr:Asp-tRNA(Asn)/Glu-tRNA(Gln) amidotransferase subunit GatC [Erysipelotrichaceae bacterium]